MKTRVLITGGAGFIGSHIVEYFYRLNRNGNNMPSSSSLSSSSLSSSSPSSSSPSSSSPSSSSPPLVEPFYEVLILDNLSTGNINNIRDFLGDDIKFVWGDISNLDICKSVMKHVDVVIHQAALGSVPRSVEDPLMSHSSNVNGFLNILYAAKCCKVKRVVYASSSSVYGDDETLPKSEDKTGNLLSPYAGTKYIDEIYAGIFSRCYGDDSLECIGLRYFNVFGPRQDPNGPYAAVIPKFMDMISKGERPVINGDGTYSRDFTYVDNVVQANILAMTTNNYNTVYNIGCGYETSINQLFYKIRDAFSQTQSQSQSQSQLIEPIYGPLRAGDIPHSLANIDRATNKLGYIPLIDVNEGLRRTVEYFREFSK